MKQILHTIIRVGAFLAIGGLLALGVSYYNAHARSGSIATFVTEFDPASDSQREKIAETYLNQYPASDLLDALETKYADSVCHTVAHPIGRAVYKRTQNFTESVKACGSTCSYGCFHGVLMQMFSTDSDTLGGVITDESSDEYIAHVKNVAAHLCTDPQVTSLVRSRFCYHGLGHVFAYVTNNNLQTAIDSCGVMPKGAPLDTCVSGVFMEHLFNASSSAELNTADARPCDAFPSLVSECYRYKARGWIQVWGGARRAMAHCDSFGKDASSCIFSIAEAAAQPAALREETGFDKLCGQLSATERDSCIDGALLKVIVINDGNDTPELCDSVAAPYRPRCREDYSRFHGISI